MSARKKDRRSQLRPYKSQYELPQGATPYLAERGTAEIPKTNPLRRQLWNSWVQDRELCHDESFHEATGSVGDVYFLHPFMLHSASKNLLREVRIITNPPVALKEPFQYDRPDGEEYSLVEAKTLKELGKPEGLKGWKITGPRELLTAAGGRIKVRTRTLSGLETTEAALSFFLSSFVCHSSCFSVF